jgi:hypothetical protein
MKGTEKDVPGRIVVNANTERGSHDPTMSSRREITRK